MVHWTRAAHARHRLGLGALVVALFLAAGMIATAANPATAPNDGVILFTSLTDGAIYSVAPDGTGLKRLWSGESPTLSPNGKRIAFVVGSPGSQLWTMNADGSDAHAVPIPIAASLLIQPTWSPDGKKIAFSAFINGGGGLVYVVNADGTNFHEVTKGFAVYPAWSPDGRWIAFDSFNNPALYDPINDPVGIFVAHPDGTGLHRLTPQESGAEQYPLWSRDGKSLIYSRLSPDWKSQRFYVQALWEVRADGTGARQLTRGFIDVAGGFSPDGKQLVFQRQRDPRVANPHLYVMNIDGSHVREFVAQMSGRSPSWGSQHTAR
jgi:Tol biopolymer transport system component